MVTIVSGAPRMYATGIKDKTRRTVQAEREAIPTFLAKVFGFAKTGPTDPQLVVGNSRTLLYGTESFDERSKYATHATVLSNTLNAKGNIQTDGPEAIDGCESPIASSMTVMSSR